jgi:hypothetical protein
MRAVRFMIYARPAGRSSGYMAVQPGCIAHCVMFRLEQAAGVPLHSVQLQPLFSQAAIIVCVEHAAAVPMQLPFQLQPPIMLHAP